VAGIVWLYPEVLRVFLHPKPGGFRMSSLKEIWNAAGRIEPIVFRTPIIQDPSGTGLRIKAEHLQRTGSFKIRGAANRVTIAVEQGTKHVITASSGNHGKALAYIAQRLGIKATIVVPENARDIKVEGMVKYGATVERCGITSPVRFARAEVLTRELGATFIPPYDDEQIIAGQGTTGLEVLEQAPDVEVVYIPVGGGGLLSGMSLAIKETSPWVKVIGVEPELGNDTYLSFQRGQIVSLEGGPSSIADGLRASQPGAMTFPIIRKYVDEMILVSEAEIEAATRWMLTTMKQVVEPSGAVSVAAALRAGPARAVALVSGGNIEI